MIPTKQLLPYCLIIIILFYYSSIMYKLIIVSHAYKSCIDYDDCKMMINSVFNVQQ